MISTSTDSQSISAHLAFAQDLNSKGIAQRIDPDQRRISCQLARTAILLIVWNVPISPITPSPISSVRSSIGLGGIRCTDFFRLYCCTSKAAEVDDNESEIPRRSPSAKSRFNRRGRVKKRCIRATRSYEVREVRKAGHAIARAET